MNIVPRYPHFLLPRLHDPGDVRRPSPLAALPGADQRSGRTGLIASAKISQQVLFAAALSASSRSSREERDMGVRTLSAASHHPPHQQPRDGAIAAFPGGAPRFQAAGAGQHDPLAYPGWNMAVPAHPAFPFEPDGHAGQQHEAAGADAGGQGCEAAALPSSRSRGGGARRKRVPAASTLALPPKAQWLLHGQMHKLLGEAWKPRTVLVTADAIFFARADQQV
jgi:hypothetical protein